MTEELTLPSYGKSAVAMALVAIIVDTATIFHNFSVCHCITVILMETTDTFDECHLT